MKDFKFGIHTPFHSWIRTIPELSSNPDGFNCQNIDILWMNMDSHLFMIIEEKVLGGYPKPWQEQAYKRIHKCCLSDELYKGCHLIVFENTSPTDGLIKLDNEWYITPEELRLWLAFKGPDEWYSRDIIW